MAGQSEKLPRETIEIPGNQESLSEDERHGREQISYPRQISSTENLFQSNRSDVEGKQNSNPARITAGRQRNGDVEFRVYTSDGDQRDAAEPFRRRDRPKPSGTFNTVTRQQDQKQHRLRGYEGALALQMVPRPGNPMTMVDHFTKYLIY